MQQLLLNILDYLILLVVVALPMVAFFLVVVIAIEDYDSYDK